MSASLSNEEIEDKYFLLGQVDILSVLNGLAHRRETVTVYFNSGQQFILTAILSARPDGLVFDLGGDTRINRLFEKAQQCTFVAFPDGIRVQFSGLAPQRFLWGDSEAFWVPIPERIIRLQRRNSYRVIVPFAQKMKTHLWNQQHQLILESTVHDLSVTGFGIIIEGAHTVTVDTPIANAVIELPNKNILESPAWVRHVTSLDRSGNGKFLLGLSFNALSHNMDVQAQKAILNIEYERHRLLGI